MLKTDANPGGTPIEAFDAYRAGVAANRAQIYLDIASGPFYGFNRTGVLPMQGVVDNWWRQGMMGGIKAHYDCIKAFSETDFTEDLKSIEVPVLLLHGDDDQVVPISVGGNRSAKMIKDATYKVYKGAPHGLMSTHQQQFNTDLLDFARQRQAAPPSRGGREAAVPRAASST